MEQTIGEAKREPVVPPPRPSNLSRSLTRNIDALAERRRQEVASETREQRFAAAITSFTGSMRFVYLHLAIYSAWILINVGLVPFVPKFDASFVSLATEASVEAIFLSTFVLISQNRTAAAADKRADLDLHINLLTEHELTKLAQMVDAIARKLDVAPEDDPELKDVVQDVAPEAVLDELDAKEEAQPGS